MKRLINDGDRYLLDVAWEAINRINNDHKSVQL